MEQPNDLNQLIDRYNLAISERDGARRAAEIYRKENDQLVQQFEQLQAASQLQSNVYRQLELRHRKQTKELDMVLEQSMRELKASDEAWKEERRENEKLKNQLEQMRTVCEVYRSAMGNANEGFVKMEDEVEQLRKERDEVRKHLWEAIKALEFIIVKTGNEPYNVQFIVKPLRDIAREALFHIQDDKIPETAEILCVDCKETKTVPYSINPQYRCDDCAGKRVRVMTPEERLEFQEDDCPSCEGTGFTGFARTFDETCSCCEGTGKLPKANEPTESA